jgi:hypothetical protein
MTLKFSAWAAAIIYSRIEYVLGQFKASLRSDASHKRTIHTR